MYFNIAILMRSIFKFNHLTVENVTKISFAV